MQSLRHRGCHDFVFCLVPTHVFILVSAVHGPRRDSRTIGSTPVHQSRASPHGCAVSHSLVLIDAHRELRPSAATRSDLEVFTTLVVFLRLPLCRDPRRCRIHHMELPEQACLDEESCRISSLNPVRTQERAGHENIKGIQPRPIVSTTQKVTLTQTSSPKSRKYDFNPLEVSQGKPGPDNEDCYYNHYYYLG
ncbi:hypothetical protein P168DRAFT_159887 [Aspergillus campestris IBT 28561]|uniref:Uncharacterized protein n=1 Tax=Aspergillus campestris (strain IBT 28561) TaxID=1392248 RepID=A0A2I1D3V1_ASPC2|nr:uncharacterized protein P168DRAFT_159887 [Aspergillus campestris IBT 28561]PKY04561.1 hypothetical protein P168DRAFT_159887 [Aspergillus campestris IBT 28561]